MALRIAFVGFRHAHLLALHRLLGERRDVAITGVCEEDAGTRAELASAGIAVTHDVYERMLADTPCDVVAVGDYYAIRGERALAALESGRHVISDKPVCTSLTDLARMDGLARAKTLKIGCMLDLGELGPYITLREMIRAGRAGEVHAITFLGQHPLLYGQRPRWFFEPGKHCGSVNDIAVHGIDIIPWLTGRAVVEITAARVWNAKVPQHPSFQDGAMLMLRLDNDGGVLGDVSYLSSDKHGYKMAPYWRFTISGSEGVLETSCNASTVALWRHDTPEIIEEPVAAPEPGRFFDDFLADIAGTPRAGGLRTERVLESSRIALLAQQAADTGKFPVTVLE